MSEHVTVVRIALNPADWGEAQLEARRMRITTRAWVSMMARRGIHAHLGKLALARIHETG